MDPMAGRRVHPKGVYRKRGEDLEAFATECWDESYDEQLEECDAALLVPAQAGLSMLRNPSSESLSSTQSTTYSGLEDITEIIQQAPEELCKHGFSSHSKTESTSGSSHVETSQSTVSSTDSSSSLPSSNEAGPSNPRKRKAGEIEGSPAFTAKNHKSNSESSNASPGLYVIAHARHLQAFFDAKQISFGVQWLVARLSTLDQKNRVNYDQINIPDIQKLQGSNEAAAPQTINILRQSVSPETAKEMQGFFAREIAATAPWRELDMEHEITLSKSTFDGFHRQSDGWYGGKVQFTAVLRDDSKTNKKPCYRIQLNWPEVGPSTRFKRQFGSKNFVRVQIPKSINAGDNGLVTFFSQRFVICGMVYRAFYAKDNNVFLVATDELAPDMSALPQHANPRPPGFMDFLNWHNPIEENLSQSMAKWATRFALGLSNSVPGIQFEKSNIFRIADEVHGDSDMTDGCGYINRTALKTLQQMFDWEFCPTAIQCRIAGAKGLLLLHPESSANAAAHPRIWLRDSQIKVAFPTQRPLSAGHLTIDVLRAAHLHTPSRLSAETIINLAENGVPHQVFIDLVKRGLDALVDALLDWDSPDAMYRLWYAVARSGHVFPARLAREAGGEARAKGYSSKDAEDEEDEDEPDEDLDRPRSAAWWGDEVSGCPSSLEETVMAFLDAGFTPGECPILADKIRHIIRTSVENYVQRYRLDVPMSLIAWIVPDPTGLLAHDEVHIISRDCRFLTEDGTQTNIILGDVLPQLTRHPCKLPTDTQKVRAVEKRELRHYTDVIVCSIQGMRRFADLLAGGAYPTHISHTPTDHPIPTGDYDGDKAIAIWDPTIVKPFTNANLRYSHPPPNFIADNFVQNSLRAKTFWDDHKHTAPECIIAGMQPFLLSGLRDTSLVGRYSNFHDLAMYLKGYSDPETIRLAYMFCHVLDAPKTGLVVIPQVHKSDGAAYQKRSPAWKETAADSERQQNRNTTHPRRPGTLPKFIMDKIFAGAVAYRDVKLKQMSDVFASRASEARDATLVKPWEDALERARKVRGAAYPDSSNAYVSTAMDAELERIRVHVDRIREEHAHKVGSASKFTGYKIEHRQDILRGVARDFAFAPPAEAFLVFSAEQVATLKASYAYASSNLTHRFPWDVAMRELGSIKARSLGPFKTVRLGFYERFTLKQSSYRSS
ncbi:RNA dependent RNA polymerase-domain-containing protein [Hygrophoropsis aurantiaca]|uniref:RNA dependent RNA polymerase-domain-containing protein n=1 Tax=Hygrophoropsis aurantiaca TaxID=72124 RepID=A0ACB8ASG0_9AGAM|nr:RNA dependent RNA polymerase-domain-containing protein [Hygrophoropsis aurantiaca]